MNLGRYAVSLWVKRCWFRDVSSAIVQDISNPMAFG